MGAYVTDGESLFRVEYGPLDTEGGERLLELENCATREIVLCPARAIARELRLVTLTSRRGGACTASDIAR